MALGIPKKMVGQSQPLSSRIPTTGYPTGQAAPIEMGVRGPANVPALRPQAGLPNPARGFTLGAEGATISPTHTRPVPQQGLLEYKPVQPRTPHAFESRIPRPALSSKIAQDRLADMSGRAALSRTTIAPTNISKAAMVGQGAKNIASVLKPDPISLALGGAMLHKGAIENNPANLRASRENLFGGPNVNLNREVDTRALAYKTLDGGVRTPVLSRERLPIHPPSTDTFPPATKPVTPEPAIAAKTAATEVELPKAPEYEKQAYDDRYEKAYNQVMNPALSAISKTHQQNVGRNEDRLNALMNVAGKHAGAGSIASLAALRQAEGLDNAIQSENSALAKNRVDLAGHGLPTLQSAVRSGMELPVALAKEKMGVTSDIQKILADPMFKDKQELLKAQVKNFETKADRKELAKYVQMQKNLADVARERHNMTDEEYADAIGAAQIDPETQEWVPGSKAIPAKDNGWFRSKTPAQPAVRGKAIQKVNTKATTDTNGKKIIWKDGVAYYAD